MDYPRDKLFDEYDSDSEISDSFREPEVTDKRTIDARVSDFFLVTDDNGLSYSNHCFTIHVHVENLFYTVDRSYVDFVELDRRLRKRFPRSNILPLPLDAAEVVEKGLADKEKSSKRSFRIGKEALSLTAARDAILTTFDATSSPMNGQSNAFRVVGKYHENFHEKVSALDHYLVGLLTLHEIVSSDDIMLFLDEEASSMEVDPDSLLTLSEHDLLLLNAPLNKCTVRRSEERSFQVFAGQYVLWRFSTVDFDIGFSVLLNGETKIPYTRYKSHEKMVCGTLEVTQNGVCELKWDNSYARLRTKQLTWTARVVKDKDYHMARAQALEIQREKKKFEDQRHALRRCAVTHAALLSGVIVNPSIVSEHAHEEKMKIRELEDEIASLKNSLRQCHQDIENGQLELDELEDELSKMQQSRQLINESWQFSLKQLEISQNEIKIAQTDISNLKTTEKTLKARCQELESDLKGLLSELTASKIREMEITNNYKEEIFAMENERETMKSSYEKTISDLELKMKEDREAAESAKAILIHDFESQLNEAKALCQTLEQRFVKATLPERDGGDGFFVDTVSERELSNRLVQLERENAMLENQKESLENEVRRLRKQMQESLEDKE